MPSRGPTLADAPDAPRYTVPAGRGSGCRWMTDSPLHGLFDEAKLHFEQFRSDLHAYGLVIGPEVELRDGQGLLCYYDLEDGHVHLSLPDPKDPVGIFQAAMFRSILHCGSEAELAELVRLLLPTLIAHELGHLLRHRRGLFGKDLWFEEQVANKFAAAIAQHHLSPAQRERLIALMRGTLAHLAPKVGSAHIATDTYLDPLEALGASGLLAPTAVRSLELMDRLLTLSPERVLRDMPQPPKEVLASFAQRQDSIEGFNEDYSSNLARYIYFQFGWMLIHLESREHHYVDEVAREYLGRALPLLPRIPAGAPPRPSHILSCHRAHTELATRVPVLSHYFFKRYRSMLLDQVTAAQGSGGADARALNTPARRLLESQDDEDPATLDFLAVAAPPELRALFPAPLASHEPPLAEPTFPCETDQRLWQLAHGGADDPAARATLARLAQLDASEIYRALPAELMVELTHLMCDVQVPAGVTMIQQGSANDDVFIITGGSFEVLLGEGAGQRRVAVMHPGEVAGDMAFLTGEPRSASIRATEASQCLVLRAADLKLLAFENPAMLMRMSRVLIRRLGRRAAEAA